MIESKTERLRLERLRLRPLRAEDLDRLHGHWTHPDVRRYLFDDEVQRRAPA